MILMDPCAVYLMAAFNAHTGTPYAVKCGMSQSPQARKQKIQRAANEHDSIVAVCAEHWFDSREKAKAVEALAHLQFADYNSPPAFAKASTEWFDIRAISEINKFVSTQGVQETLYWLDK